MRRILPSLRRKAGKASPRRRLAEALEPRCLLTSGYLPFYLSSNQAGSAMIQDPNLVNAWGIGLSSSSGDFWFSDNGSGLSSPYSGDVNGGPLSALTPPVTVPSGSPTGQVFNSSFGFPVRSGTSTLPATFLYAQAGGQISGWNPNVPPSSSQAINTVTTASAEYTGLAIASFNMQPYLYAANFASGSIDVFNSSFGSASLPGSFSDTALTSLGYAPYNIAALTVNGSTQLYVAYAKRGTGTPPAPVPGAGNGAIAEFSTGGNLLSNLVVGGSLNEPWGLAIAPSNFGDLSNKLLVANTGSRQIEGYNASSGSFAGTLSNTSGNPITFNGLHGLSFGNGVTAGNSNILFFTAGPAGGQNGLFGSFESALGVQIDSVGAGFSATAGTAFSGTIATFTDANMNATAGSFQIMIDWGDGGQSPGTAVALGAGSFLVTGSHTYQHTGSDSVTITITDALGSTTVADSLATVAAPKTIVVSLVKAAATEGLAFSGAVATFTDADGNTQTSAYTASIVWGDGVTTTGTVSSNAGVFTVSGAHTYAEEGSVPFAVLVSDTDGDSGSATATVQVADAPLLATAIAAVATTEGSSFQGVVATFTDADPNGAASDYTATIDWGDGTTTTGVIAAQGGGFQVGGSHTYADEGTFTATVVIADAGGAAATVTDTANVADADSLVGRLNSPVITEGALFSGTLATFSDAYSGQSAGDLAATIDWGDGTTTTGAVTSAAGSFAVSGSHTYADEGSFAILVNLADDAPGTAVGTAGSTWVVAEGDTLAAQAIVISPTEGQAFQGAVATFSDTDTANTTADFTASIDWGDGTTTSGTITGSAGNYTVSGTHTYAEEGKYTLSTTFSDDAPGTAAATASAVITAADAPLSATAGPTLQGTEGKAVSGTLATFSDADPAGATSDYTATVAWGDDTTSTATVVASGSGFAVDGNHTYSEGGNYTAAVTIADSGGAQAAVLTNVDIADWPITASGVTINGKEGSPFSGAVATFIDSDPDGGDALNQYVATIDWGDGTTTTGVVTGGNATFTVSGSHTFADEAAAVSVSITDAGGATATAQDTANIADADTFTATGAAVATTEGQTFSGTVATFSDTYTANTADDLTAQIDWGDGTVATGTITGANGSFTVSGAHPYAEEGVYSAHVTLSDDAPGTAQATATASVQVSDAPLSAAGLTVTVVEGATFSGRVATFTDADPNGVVADYSATIDWGDGTITTGQITALAGGFQVSGTHVFGADGTNDIKVSIVDGGSSTTAQSVAVVQDAPLAVTAVPVDGSEQTPLGVVVARLVDSGPADPVSGYFATINWGDGTTTPGTLSGSGGTYSVTGTHTYADEGHYTVSVTAGEIGGNSGASQATAAIVEELLVDGTRGTPTERWVNEVYHDLLNRQADSGGLVYWSGRVTQGVSLTQIVATIESSQEYRDDEVDAIYVHYLHRHADPGGEAYFSSLLLEDTVEQISAIVAGSLEYFQDRGGGTNVGFLAALYEDVLNRPIDPGGQAYFENLLATGTPRSVVAATLLSSPEYIDDLVQAIYQQLLERPADPGGLAYWSGWLEHGARDETVIAGLAGSQEYFNKTAP